MYLLFTKKEKKKGINFLLYKNGSQDQSDQFCL